MNQERQHYRPHGTCECGQPATVHQFVTTVCKRCADLQRKREFQVRHGESTYAARKRETAMEFASRIIAPKWDKHFAEFWHKRGLKVPPTCRWDTQGACTP